GNGGFLHCIQMDTSVNAANQVVSVGADIAFDADPKFFACLVRFESSSVPTTLPTAYDVYPLDGRHDGGYYTVKIGRASCREREGTEGGGDRRETQRGAGSDGHACIAQSAA